MNHRVNLVRVRPNLGLLTLCGLLAVAPLACTNSSPAQPSGGTPSLTTPKPTQPADSAQIRNLDQPVTLVVVNAVSTQSGTVYAFEVASDPGFASKVQTKDNVAEGANGQTSVKLDNLAAGKDYYWHVRAQSGTTFGLFSATFKFTIGPAITIGAPSPVSPPNGVTTAGWPALIVSNATRSGPVGAIVYQFDISTSSTFTPVLVTGTVPEGAGQTTFAPPGQPPSSVTLYWRAAAIDQTNAITGPTSVVQTFITTPPTAQATLAAQLGLVLWPGQQPPGTNGHAVLGPGWDVQHLVSFTGVPFTSPLLEQLQIFDLIDRGLDPDSAIGWMNTHGYGTAAVYYDPVKSIGFQWQYMSLVSGAWELVLRVGA